jgi:hypothetical protein
MKEGFMEQWKRYNVNGHSYVEHLDDLGDVDGAIVQVLTRWLVAYYDEDTGRWYAKTRHPGWHFGTLAYVCGPGTYHYASESSARRGAIRLLERGRLIP